MSLPLALVIVVIALDPQRSEDTIDLEAFASLALLAGSGLEGGVYAIGSLLEEKAHQLIGRLEERRAHQHLQLLDGHSRGLRGLEAND